MMNRTYIVFILLFTGAPELFSIPVDADKASRAAQNYMNKKREAVNSVSDIVIEKSEGQIYFYVINFKEGGWVMIPADDRAVPILAYSPDGTYHIEDEKPPAFLCLIDEYKEQMDIVRQTEPARNSEIAEMWNMLMAGEDNNKSSKVFTGKLPYIIGDLLLYDTARGYVAWGQEKNNSGSCNPAYNKYASKNFLQGLIDDCGCDDRPPVGCGAVAMGQVMWYWQWPRASTYRTYNWSLMPAAIYNSTPWEQADAIAHLLRDCAGAATMVYACAGSFALPGNVRWAMANRFSFKAARLVDRDSWGSAWHSLIKTEIDCGRPVIYKGEKSLFSTEKHYFVIDGYDAYVNPKFHLNLGRRGSFNCFLYLDDITRPPGWGNFDYRKRHSAIIGISPTRAENVNVTDVSYTFVTDNVVIEAQQNISLPAPGKSLIVESGASLTLVAGSSITLNPGFEVRPGGTFTTNIEPSYAAGNMDITVSSWPASVEQHYFLEITSSNANSFDFVAKDRSGNIVHQSARPIHDTLSAMWYGGVNPGVYDCTVRFRNNYGRTLEHNWLVTVTDYTKSASSVDSTDMKLQETVTSVHSETDTSDDITVYPNPASGTVHISIARPFTSYSLKVYSATGALVYQDAEINLPVYSFDMSRFADGTYLLQMDIDRQQVSKRIVLAR